MRTRRRAAIETTTGGGDTGPLGGHPLSCERLCGDADGGRPRRRDGERASIGVLAIPFRRPFRPHGRPPAGRGRCARLQEGSAPGARRSPRPGRAPVCPARRGENRGAVGDTDLGRPFTPFAAERGVGRGRRRIRGRATTFGEPAAEFEVGGRRDGAPKGVRRGACITHGSASASRPPGRVATTRPAPHPGARSPPDGRRGCSGPARGPWLAGARRNCPGGGRGSGRGPRRPARPGPARPHPVEPSPARPRRPSPHRPHPPPVTVHGTGPHRGCGLRRSPAHRSHRHIQSSGHPGNPRHRDPQHLSRLPDTPWQPAGMRGKLCHVPTT